MSLPLPLYLLLGALSLGFSVGLCVHVLRTGREIWWLGVILFFQPAGGLIYFVAIVLPDLFGGARARSLGKAARDTLDPGREYRRAQQLMEDAPTVGNRMRLAQAAFGLGRLEEAEKLYAEAASGIHADDPALLLGRARALLELDRPGEALTLLERLYNLGDEGQTPASFLALGRAYHALGRMGDAEPFYRTAAARLPGLEGMARLARFLADTGRAGEARETLTEIDKRAARATAHFRKEAKLWRDFAAEKVTPA
jgi:hypothetical protein